MPKLFRVYAAFIPEHGFEPGRRHWTQEWTVLAETAGRAADLVEDEGRVGPDATLVVVEESSPVVPHESGMRASATLSLIFGDESVRLTRRAREFAPETE